MSAQSENVLFCFIGGGGIIRDQHFGIFAPKLHYFWSLFFRVSEWLGATTGEEQVRMHSVHSHLKLQLVSE